MCLRTKILDICHSLLCKVDTNGLTDKFSSAIRRVLFRKGYMDLVVGQNFRKLSIENIVVIINFVFLDATTSLLFGDLNAMKYNDIMQKVHLK